MCVCVRERERERDNVYTLKQPTLITLITLNNPIRKKEKKERERECV